MHTSADNSYPKICREVGLTCETCTADSARQLAAVCKGLRGKIVGQLFVQIYPHPACSGMHAHFAAHYAEASTPRIVNTPPLAMAAVA